MNEIANEYGRGLFLLARENGKALDILDEIRLVSPLLTEEYIHLLIDPDVPRAERVSLVGEAFGGQVDSYLLNFLKLMTERNIASEIHASFAEYEKIFYEECGIVRVTAECAVELSNEQKKRLEEKLVKNLGQEVDVQYLLNPKLIGGMKLTYNNKEVNNSVEHKLKEITDRLAGVTV